VTIECPKCQTKNPDKQSFCGDCGTPLPDAKEAVYTKTMETPAEELTTGSTFAGRYQIIEELGIGGMGKVYKVFDKEVKTKVALKFIKPEVSADKKTIERFRNEIKVAREISHKNVCRMYDLNKEKGNYFITMEYISGQDLRGLIRQSGQLAIGTAINIAKKICEGLAEAHKLGVIHRDLKPSNIMIDKEGNVRIMDFGIARSVEAKGVTEKGIIIGTPDYISPEQVEGEEADQQSDIYSLGVILYEMVTGRVPFEGKTAVRIIMKHKDEMPPDPKKFNPQISEDLRNVIMRCMEKDRERRYQGASALCSKLTKIEKGISITERNLPKRKPFAVGKGLKKFFIPALVFILLVIIGLIIWQLLPKGKVIPISSEKPSIAVLPFKDLSPHKDQEYFCDGMADTLIHVLTNIEDLRVVARTSAFSFKGKEQDIREIGRTLNAETVLEGSVQKAGNKLRITTQLIKVEDGYHLWSEQYNRDMDDVFSIQDEISLMIADKLKIKLASKEKTLLVKRYTDNLEAYNLYLKGRFFLSKSTLVSLRESIKYFQQAIEKDPTYALAYAGIADCYILLGVLYTSPKEAFPRAKVAAEKALEIDEALAEAYASLGLVRLFYDWDWPSAEQELLRAIELNPKYATAHIWYSVYLTVMGMHDDAINEAKRALELDPISPLTTWLAGTTFYYARQFDQAIKEAQKALEIDPNNLPAHMLIFMAYLEKFEYTKAIAQLQKGMDISGSGELPQITRQLISYALLEEYHEIEKVSDELNSGLRQEYFSPYYIASFYLTIDQEDKAFEWLERAYQEHDHWLIILRVDPKFDSIRSDPRYKTLLKKMNLEQ